MSFLDRIEACNHWHPAEFLPFHVDGDCVGRVRPGFAEQLRQWPSAFQLEAGGLRLHPGLIGFERRTETLQEILGQLVEQGVVSHLHGEQFPVTASGREHAKFLVDRACAAYFGIRAFGQHLNGIVRRDGQWHMWIGRRSATRRVFPGHLDHLVAGGLPWGISLAHNLIKECHEEASIPKALAARAVPVGLVTYCRDSDRGLKPDVLYCYDLELPEDFEPACRDGEVEEFYLWPMDQVIERVRETDDFKPNCSLVIIDFLVRRGFIDPESPDYLAIVNGLRPPLP